MIRNAATVVGIALLMILPGGVGAQDLVISELMAVNDSTIQDEDGDFSDWFEVFNAGSSTVDVGGYCATDDQLELAKWRFPSIDLAPGSFLLVFASDKDRRNPGSELHANFKLTSRGEYLALVAPDGVTPVWEFKPFPEQVGDFSYGLSQNGSLVTLVGPNAPAKTLIPTNGALGLAWTEIGFDDSTWISDGTGVGYDRNADYGPLIDTDVRSVMEGENTTAYIRVPFTVSDPSISSLVLRMKYDDGFIAYINGVRVAGSNDPSPPSWDSSATTLHDDSQAVIFEEFAIPNAGAILQMGDNVLAIQGLNDNLGSSDFLIVPELEGSDSGELDPDTKQFFPRPTPGGANLQGYPGISEKPRFSVFGTVFTGTLSLNLIVNSPNAVIRYTTNGSEPTESSTRFTNTISLTSTSLVRARSFESGLSPSPTVSEAFIRLSSDVQSFNSDLPIVIVDNFGAGGVPSGDFQPAFMAVFEPLGGRSRLTDATALESRIGIKVRGSSTAGRPKKSYSFEFWDEKNEDKDLEPLGMPEESDWILYGAYNFDRALIRNPFIYELSNRVGRWAARSRFIEVFVNTGGGSLSMSDYAGVYSFMEKIKRGRDRVPVERLSASIDSEPDISGGYMMKIDRLDPGDSGFSAGGQRIAYVYPKEDFISGPQADWLRDHINEFVSVLNGANYRHPQLGYRRYIDPVSWVDHHVLNVLPMNVDALRLSAYFFKKRGEPIEFGAIWDFDRSMESTDGRDDNPTTWNGTGDATRFFDYPWWGRLFDDVDFWQLWIDRWTEFRRGAMSTSSISFLIDTMAEEIREAQVRNFQKWTSVRPRTSFQWEVDHLKQWLATRANWIDGQFVAPPRFSSPGRKIPPGFVLRMTAPEGTIYYTLDGTDPRQPGGAVAPGARVYSGSVVLEENARVVARARATGLYSAWSGQMADTFYIAAPGLVVTEIMYHPPDPLGTSPYSDDDFEFIELMNIENGPLNLGGIHFTEGIEFVFPDMVLSAGEFVVAVRNREAFESRYGTNGIRIAGEYQGNLDNDTDTIGLSGALEEPILLFDYNDLWYTETDGGGNSLIILDPFASAPTWRDPDSWWESTVILGTPGTEDPGLTSLGGRQRPGDSNQDGVLDISDAMSYLRRLFEGLPLLCDGDSLIDGGNLVLLDVNTDSNVNLSDVIYLLDYLFKDGAAPALGTQCVRIEGCPNVCRF